MLKGFSFSAVEAAIAQPDRPDLGLIYSDRPAAATGFFTSNSVKAAPVLVSEAKLASARLQAVIINSGNANSCTGTQGMADAEEMADLAAQGLGIDPGLVAVCSTGIIGRPLPMGRIAAAAPRLVPGLRPDGVDSLARAIMTTDTVPKTVRAELDLAGRPAGLVGVAKGSGMIHPMLEPAQEGEPPGQPQATMLAFLMTDAKVSAFALREALSDALPSSFHSITVDGDTSTNDSLIMMANGAAGGPEIQDFGSPGGSAFYAAVGRVCRDLALQLVADAEGGTKVVTIVAKGAGSEMEADMVVMAVALSPLCKTAFYGADPNWGRIMVAAGSSGARVETDKVEISFDGVKVFAQGLPADQQTLAAAEEVLKNPAFKVTIDLKAGEFEREFITSDLSPEYVRINSKYTT